MVFCSNIDSMCLPSVIAPLYAIFHWWCLVQYHLQSCHLVQYYLQSYKY
uniref:Uncharacterized protein n=1 Tax=Anguilla anguilla TaxID=7936 RepID=A0A0E9VYH5_ANGAN